MEERDLIIFAFRYCLFRRTYASTMMASFLQEKWSELEDHDKEKIVEEIREEIHREEPAPGFDYPTWVEFLTKINEKIYP